MLKPIFSKKRCKECASIDYQKAYRKKLEEKSKQPNGNNKPLYRKSSFKPRAATGELMLFRAIWDSLPANKRISCVSGIMLEFSPSIFMHVLPKGRYPEYRLLWENILLGTQEEHFLIDQGSTKQREAYILFCKESGIQASFDVFYDYKQELYNRLVASKHFND